MRIVSGVHPETGEVISVKCKVNFPLKDPETDAFILDEKGEIQFPKRHRLRDEVLSDGRLKPDPRPMMTSVAFGNDMLPEDRMNEMLEAAWYRQESRIRQAQRSGVNFYPHSEDEFDDNLDDPDPEDHRYVSPHEFVYDPDLDRDVPRPAKGLFKRKAKASATPPAAAPSPSPVESPAGSKSPEGESTGGA